MKVYPYRTIRQWAEAQRNTRTATDLAESGIPVFPVKQDKKPDTAHSFKDATTDPSRIAFFFRKPGCSWGCLPGCDPTSA